MSDSHSQHLDTFLLRAGKPGVNVCEPNEILAVTHEIQKLRGVISTLRSYFTSGNSVPVERATIRTKDFLGIVGETPQTTCLTLVVEQGAPVAYKLILKSNGAAVGDLICHEDGFYRYWQEPRTSTGAFDGYILHEIANILHALNYPWEQDLIKNLSRTP